MASSSSSSVILRSKYDVFISFRGEDTRKSFTSHLYAALCQKKIAVFIDDDGLKSGDEISPVLWKAIEESKVSVIIFSKDYASSRWCLDELEKILECRETKLQLVIPVFYNINPTVVRHQTESFKDAFVNHEQRFKDMPEKVRRWRAALSKVSQLSGFDSKVFRTDLELVDKIVGDVIKRLEDMSPLDPFEGLVGMNSHVERINSLLCVGQSDFRVVGIWGMGGIGKTTMAVVIYNLIADQFEGCCFIANVREESAKYGLVRLKENLLSGILQEKVNIGTVDIIPLFIKRRVQNKRVLIVLDDVTDLEQLRVLTRGFAGFGPGSRIIITTRDKHVLLGYGVENIYQVEKLKYKQAFQLFCQYAFERKCCPKEFLDLSNKVIDYAKGNPLALRVLGATIFKKTKHDLEKILYRLRNIPDRRICDILEISYNQLDREEQNIFLDIVCFFKGEDRNLAVEVLNGCYFNAYSGLDSLIGKSLITISYNNKLEVHDLLQEMGRQIVRQESLEQPGKRSRLWKDEDITHVLKTNTGTDTIGCILLDMSKINRLCLSSNAFDNIANIRLLKFYVPCPKKCREGLDISRVYPINGIKYLSDELRYLHWDGYPSNGLPSKFNPENLVELKLPYSKVRQLWKGSKDAFKLKSINLCFSEHLIDFPNLSNAPELENIYLEDCRSLLAIPPGIQHFTNLRILNLRGCESLTTFPEDIHFRSLVTLDLSYCSSLTKFPKILGNIKYLYLSGTEIKEVPSSIEHIKGLEELILKECEDLKTISCNICNLTSLEKIDVSRCPKLEKLPENLGNLIHLKEFNANRTALSQLPPTIRRWKEIISLGLASSNFTEIPKCLCSLSSLEYLDLSGNKFRSLPLSIRKLSKLRCLVLRESVMLQSIPELPQRLTHLDASDSRQLQSLPEPPSSPQDFDESKLENIFECCPELPLAVMEFKFTNCLKVKQNLADLQQRIQLMAVAGLRLCYQKVFDEIPLIRLCLPGTEIPDWFCHQSLGSSIIIKLPSHSCNSSFIGFALSAVIAFQKSYDEESIKINCSYHFETEGEDFEWDCIVKLPNALIESDHIVLGYSPCTDISILNGDCTSVSFEFSLVNGKHGGPAEGCTVRCCGVYPLYAEPNMSGPKRKFYDSFKSGNGNVNQTKRKCYQLKGNCRCLINTSLMAKFIIGGLLLLLFACHSFEVNCCSTAHFY